MLEIPDRDSTHLVILFRENRYAGLVGGPVWERSVSNVSQELERVKFSSRTLTLLHGPVGRIWRQSTIERVDGVSIEGAERVWCGWLQTGLVQRGLSVENGVLQSERWRGEMGNDANGQVKLDRNMLIEWAIRTHGALQLYRAWNGSVRKDDWKKSCVGKQGGVVHLIEQTNDRAFFAETAEDVTTAQFLVGPLGSRNEKQRAVESLLDAVFGQSGQWPGNSAHTIGWRI